MADVEDEQNGLDNQQEKKKEAKKRMFNSGAEDLEKVTDFEMEQEITYISSVGLNLILAGLHMLICLVF